MTIFGVFEESYDVSVPELEQAIAMTKGLDIPEEGETRLPIEGQAALLVLGEFGAMVYKCAWVPEGKALAVVVYPPSITLCPSVDGLNGVFIEPYDKNRHGEGVGWELGADLWDYSNITARLLGWKFAAGMWSIAQEFS